MKHSVKDCRLAFAWLDFVASERFFGLDVFSVLARLWVVLV